MAEDWDLYAVVRSCKSAQNTSTKPSTPSSSYSYSSTTFPYKEDSLACLAELKFEEENDGFPFCFPDFEEPKNNAFQELQQFYKPFLPNPTTITTTTTNNTSLIPNSSSFGEIGGSSSVTHHVQYSQQQTNIMNRFTTPNGSYIPGFESEHAQQGLKLQTQVQNQRIQRLQRPQATMNLQSQRPRKMRNQQKKTMCEVAQDNLSSDMWAWRKYGQKPIKGSPYPRNYYRCSSSKGCAARKQVERNSKNPSMFVVTYTGDHTHPRPTHRNSLAGSSRSKYSTMRHNPTQNKDSNTESLPLGFANHLSPTTSLTVQATHEEETIKEAEKQNEEMELDEEDFDVNEDEEDEEEDDEEDILIPNMAMSEDIFMGFQELGCRSPCRVGGSNKRSLDDSNDQFSDKGKFNLGGS